MTHAKRGGVCRCHRGELHRHLRQAQCQSPAPRGRRCRSHRVIHIWSLAIHHASWKASGVLAKAWVSGIAEHRIVSEISGFHGILKCQWVAGRQYGNYFLPYNRNKINTIFIRRVWTENYVIPAFFNPSIFTEVMSWKKLNVIFLFSFSVRKERTIVGINTFARGDT